ncbi:uncharacterized protein LOC144823426 [Lissotriton helveticus]
MCPCVTQLELRSLIINIRGYFPLGFFSRDSFWRALAALSAEPWLPEGVAPISAKPGFTRTKARNRPNTSRLGYTEVPRVESPPVMFGAPLVLYHSKTDWSSIVTNDWILLPWFHIVKDYHSFQESLNQRSKCIKKSTGTV